MARGRTGRGRRGGRLDLNTVQGLEEFVKQQGLEQKAPAKERVFSAIRRIGGFLSATNAAAAGFTRGILRDDVNPLTESVQRFRQSLAGEGSLGFGNVIRENIFQPKTRAERLAVSAIGLTADIIFDPLTYLTFGMGAGTKVGTKTLNRTGTQVFQSTARELSQKLGNKADDVTRSLMSDVITAGRNTDEIVAKYTAEGVDSKIINRVAKYADTYVDKGGIKFAGQTIISGDAIRKSPLGKGAALISNIPTVQKVKSTLGKAFIYGYGKDPKILSILEKMSVRNMRDTANILKENAELFKDLSDKQLTNFFDEVFKKKLEIAPLKGATRQAAKQAQRTERLVFQDKKLQELADKMFEGPDSYAQRLAKMAGIPEEDAIKFYIPSTFADKVSPDNIGVKRALTSPKLGYRERFTGVTEDLIKNPYEAYSRRAIEVAVNRNKSDAIRSVANNFGVPYKNLSSSDAFNAGLKEYRRKVVDGEVRVWLPESIHKELTDIDNQVGSLVDELAKYSGFDFATRLFKGYVTSLFPGFHVRNITSNQFNNMLKIGVDVANPRIQKEAFEIALGINPAKTITTKTGQELSYKQVRDLVEENSDLLSAGPFGQVEQLLKEESSRIQRPGLRVGDFNPLSADNIALRAGRRIGQFSEEQSKMVAVISSLKEGKTIDEAIKTAEDALFNYGKLSDFERKVMRRLVPFYTFARKNAELQMKTLASNPGRVAGQLKFIKNAGEAVGSELTEEDLEGLPDFVLENLGIKSGVNQFGQSTYLTGFGLPLEEFMARLSGDRGIVGNIVKTTLESASPLVKFPIEYVTGVDVFRDRPISELNNAQDFKSILDVMPKPVANQFKELIEYRENKEYPVYVDGQKVGTRTQATANPFILHFLRNLPTSRISSTVGFLSDEEETNMSKFLRLSTGIREYSIDRERQKFFDELNRKKELQQWLVSIGLLKDFQTVYEPGGSGQRRSGRR